jgi:hypothetical protein
MMNDVFALRANIKVAFAFAKSIPIGNGTAQF